MLRFYFKHIFYGHKKRAGLRRERRESEKSPALSYASINAVPIVPKKVHLFQSKIITKKFK
jgi:hypothetical protein